MCGFRILLALLLPLLGQVAVAQSPSEARLSTESASRPFVVAGYLPSYRVSAWDPDLEGPLTDVIYFNAIPQQDGSLPTDAVPEKVQIALAQFRRSTAGRISITIGGWGHSEIMTAVCGDAEKRKQLVTSLRMICEQTAIDSVDFDWEHPESPEQWDQYLQLIKDTKQVVSPLGGICSLALAPWNAPPSEAWDVADRIHLMSYDHDYPHATLEKSTDDIDRVLGWGCPAEKLVLGIPFYGRAKDWKATTYATLVANNQSDGSDLSANGVAFNGPVSVAKKVQLASERGLAGVMIWEIGQDTTESESSLLRVIQDTLEKVAN